MSNAPVIIDSKYAPIPCPDCGHEAEHHKEPTPLKKIPRNAEFLRGEGHDGMAECVNVRCERNETIFYQVKQ